LDKRLAFDTDNGNKFLFFEPVTKNKFCDRLKNQVLFTVSQRDERVNQPRHKIRGESQPMPDLVY